MQRYQSYRWTKTLIRPGVLLSMATVLGAVAGAAWMTLALGTLVVLAVHYWRLYILVQHLANHRRLRVTPGNTLWHDLQNLLENNQRQQRYRKRHLLDLLRAYQAAANALPDAIVVVDRNTQRIAWSNQAATALLGLHRTRDRSQPIAACLHPIPLAHWLASGRHAEPILDLTSPTDPNIRLHIRLVPYSDHHWLLVARDVTKLLHLEQVRRDFVANVSHELRTPLTVVHGYLDMLEPEDFPDTGPMLEEMRKQSQRMSQLVEDLLTLSRLENSASLELEPISMPALLDTLVREASALSQGRHTICLVDDGSVDLLGSVRDLHSAFSNLVSNAVRYTPDEGHITIRLSRIDDGAALCIQDSGYGIASEHIPRLTERFYRVSSSRDRASGGTGLGLSIVKHVLGQHAAHLEIKSEVGIGSEFCCRFDACHVIDRDTPPKERAAT